MQSIQDVRPWETSVNQSHGTEADLDRNPNSSPLDVQYPVSYDSTQKEMKHVSPSRSFQLCGLCLLPTEARSTQSHHVRHFGQTFKNLQYFTVHLQGNPKQTSKCNFQRPVNDLLSGEML